ncbi:MAG: hypothetical protein JOS17DRAFT_760703 [Linnemannia elongata]|nr:MAG: hypothetical protein JOS17DRAFT_760703 [Linnemannia elongata]
MELDEAPAPTSRLDHLAELATSPTHANVHPPASSSSSTSSSSTSSSSRAGQQYTHHPHSQQHDESSKHSRTSSQSQSQSKSHNHSSSHSQSRPHMIQQQLEAESGASGWSRSPITPTTTRKFNRMAIHEVLDGQNSPSFKRKGSPEEGSFSDPPTSSSSRLNSRVSSSRAYGHPSDSNHSHPPHHPHHAHFAPSSSSHQPNSPRFRQESPMPASNSDDDEDSDIRNYKKRRMLTSSTSHHHQQNNHHSNSSSHSHHHHHKSSPSSSSPNGGGLTTPAGPSSTGGAGAQAEVMDQVRNTLKLKQQQKAIIEARQGGGGVHPLSASTPTTASSPPSNGNSSSSKPKEGITNQPVTEKNPSGISVFHGSASFAALNRRPLTSPKNPKNAKSLTIFAPSYSESSLSIRSAPLQPSHGHNIMSMNPRTSQPLRHQTAHHHQPHPFSQHQHQATPTQSTHGSIPQPLRSPKTAGHVRKSSRATLRAGPHTAGLDSSSGTLPAPILSSHTGPLPSPMYPHPNTPFHPSSHASLAAAAAAAASTNAAAAAGTMSKHHFMETVSNLFDSVDSSRSLKHTLEEQIRKSAQLLQTLQSSGTMIESLVRGQFKELEKGVLEKFESELDHLSARVRQLEEHQGLTPPPKKARISAPTTAASTATVSSQNAMTGVVSTSNSTSTLSSSSSSPKAGSTSPMSSSPLHSHHSGSGSSMKDGMLPTPPLNKTQDSAMEVEDDEELPTAPPSSESATTSTTPPPQQQDQAGSSSEYRSSVKKLQERVASLEKRQDPAPASATATVQA